MANKDNVGAPTKYKKEYDELAYKFCLLGATDVKLAEFFGVAESTIHLWKLKHESFSESIKKGKQIADAEVASSLYHRALGYSHPEVKVFNNQGEIVTHDTVKHYAPDPTAAIFWLKNRHPANWRDKTETKVTLSDDFDSLLSESLNDEE
jgi:hypothetical protein